MTRPIETPSQAGVGSGEPILQGQRLAALTGICLLALVAGSWGARAAWPGAVVALLFVVAYVTGGVSGAVNGWAALRRGSLDVNVLMLVAALGAAAIGSWLEGGVLLFLFSLSETLQVYALGRTTNAIRSLMDLRPDEAHLRDGDRVRRVPVEVLVPGDVVVVRPGERLPADGVVVGGASDVDQATITGESVPVAKGTGDEVFAATINGNGVLEVRVTRRASESTLARIIELVAEAQSARAPTQRLIDRFGARYAWLVIGGSLLQMAVPPLVFGASFEASFYRAMTLLVVASPCALVISTPASYLSAIANAARRGILLKGGAYLEAAALVDIVAIDKTGTITTGRPVVTDVLPLDGLSAAAVLGLAAAVERHSDHLLGAAIVAEAAARGASVAEATAIRALPGLGIQARVAGERLTVGNARLFEAGGLSEEVTATLGRLHAAGKTAMVVAADRPLGILAVADAVRPSARPMIAALRAAGVRRVVMITGDNAEVAQAVAAQVGIHPQDVYAGLLPAEKVLVIDALSAEGRVAFVGDGVNDAPALASASVGIAMGAGGSDVALETADVVLMGDQLERLGHVFALGRAARRVVAQNVAFSIGVIVVLVVATVLRGIPLPLGVVGHEGSTVLVVLNGLRLLRFGQRD